MPEKSFGKASGKGPEKVSEKVEKALMDSILTGTFPPGNPLPSERELAAKFSVTRPTVREALQRLSRDGWIAVRQRRATIVNDFWAKGNLNVLSAIAGGATSLPPDFVIQLLEFRAVIAPDYARKAVQNHSLQLVGCLARTNELGDDPRGFMDFDWELHRTMAILSENRIHPLILNSFTELYFRMAARYFAAEDCREASRRFYKALLKAAVDEDAPRAGEITRLAMEESLLLWRRSL